MWTSIAIFEQFAVGDLSDVGSLLFLLAAGLVVGPSVGVTVALLIARHKNALATGLLTLPLMMAAVVVTFSLLDNVVTDAPVVTALTLGLALALAIAAIWLARHLTAARG